MAGGRFTKPAESRYSPVEGELAALVDGLYKAKHFIIGMDKLIVAVDHKPLLGLLNDKSLADIDNPRLLMLKEKTMWFNFQAVWVRGRDNCAPDFLSRLANPRLTTKEARISVIMGLADQETEPSVMVETDLIDGVVASLTSLPGVTAVTFDMIREEVAKDEEMSTLVKAIENMEQADRLPDRVGHYDRYRDSLSVIDGVPMYGKRVIVPASLRQSVLECLHSAHQCPVRMLDRAQHSVFWSGITADLDRVRQGCEYCNRNAPSQPAMPPQPLASPEYPFQMISADYFDIKGRSWLVIVDRFSGWLSVHYYPRESTASDLIKSMKEYFCTFGIAESFSSDGAKVFTSQQFTKFLKDWGVKEHRVSSAYHAHGNLRAETSVKSCKRILMENTRSDGSPDIDKVTRAIMQHRNTPDTEYKLSPAQIVFGRPIKDFLPINPATFSPSEVWIDNREKRELALRPRIMRGLERWSQHTRQLSELQAGDKVLIQNQAGAGKIAKKWDKSGQVIESLGHGKYRVRVDGSGRVTDRNRQFLRSFTPATPTLPGPTPNTPVVEQGPVTELPSEQPPMTPVRPEPSVHVQTPAPVSPAVEEGDTFSTPVSSPIAPRVQEQEPQLQSQQPETTPRRSSRVRKPVVKFDPSEYH